MKEYSTQIPGGFWTARRAHWKQLITDREEQVFLILTLVIGALVGLAVVAFILVTERFALGLFPPGGAHWRSLLIPVIGSLTMGFFLFRYFPMARGSGVPQAKAALFARNGYISLRTVFGKFFCTAGTIASGIPLGREGPSVQVGGGIASVLGRWVGLRPEKVKELIPVGTAAAIAAAFNTPLAAVLFTLEEIMGDLHAPVLGSVVLASATSWAVLRIALGNAPLFKVPQYQLVSPWEFAAYAVLGLVGGLVSVVFTQTLQRLRNWFLRWPRRSAWYQPAIGGLIVGLMGWFVPQVLGVGYRYVGDVLNGSMVWKFMLLLIALKIVAVSVSYASGNAGGIFGPSLFLGAMLGGVIGSGVHHFFPLHSAEPGAYALVGMGAVFAGIIRVPMTSVVMIFELTQDYAVIVPLMIANLVSYFVAGRLQKEPIYDVLAKQDGIHLPRLESRSRANVRQVGAVMRPAEEQLVASETIAEALERIAQSKEIAWPVLDEGFCLGLVTREKLQQFEQQGDSSRTLGSILNGRDFPHLHPDQFFDLALERMGTARTNLLPVVSRADIHQLLGVVRLRDVVASYGLEHHFPE